MMYEVVDGVRKGQIAAASSKQEEAVLKLGKVHAFFFDADQKPIVKDGKHSNGLVSLDRLKQIGFYD